MKLEERVHALEELGNWVLSGPAALELAILKSIQDNPWFTRDNIELSLNSIQEKYLQRDQLQKWAGDYSIPNQLDLKVGLINAGNLPLVGLHDLIVAFISGASAYVKPSSKDTHLISAFIKYLQTEFPGSIEKINLVDKIKMVDAVIATGSDNTARYFQAYFGHLPHIIRKNRNSIAVIGGNETTEELKGLADDVFSYFGLGCRNVSFLHVPAGYDFTEMIEVFKSTWPKIADHTKYRNNYDYNLACSMLNQEKLIISEPVLLYEKNSPASRIATLNYRHYSDIAEVVEWLEGHRDHIQSLVSSEVIDGIDFSVLKPGTAQFPSLSDYADGVDTMEFVLSLTNSK